MNMPPPDNSIVITVIEALAGLATFGALLFTGNIFLRARRTEQIRLLEGILPDLNGKGAGVWR